MAGRRRRFGALALQQKELKSKRYGELGQLSKAKQLEEMKSQLALFKERLEEFARQHRKEIRRNPSFRAKFYQMCAKIGVDPLASNKGYWSILGMNDFYYELGIQIIQVCMETRGENGGILYMGDLHRRVEMMRGRTAEKISVDDVENAITRLAPLGGGFQVINMKMKKMVKSVPLELNTDHTRVMELAMEKDGHFSMHVLGEELKWTMARAEDVLDYLLMEGMTWVDDQTEDGEREYWFPGLILRFDSE